MNALSGTGGLVRLILRRDRIALSLWIGFIALVAFSTANAFIEGYPTAAALQAYADEVALSPVTVALIGPVHTPTLEGMVAWRWTIQGILSIGLASMLTVIRHTRSEENAGRRELIGSTRIGRHAPLMAALIVTFAADLLVAVLVVGLLINLGLPAAGSLALGLSVAAFGWLLAVIAGVAAQLTENPGSARGITAAVLGLFWLLRGLGDAGGSTGGLSWLSWLSPFVWARFTRPYAGEQWWVFLLFAGAVVLLIAVAFALSARRDVGAGLLPSRLGRGEARPGLRSPLALAWRLQRGTLVGWTAAFAVIGVAFGFVTQTVSDVLTVNPQMMEFFARTAGNARPSDAVFTLFLAAFGPVIGVSAILAVLRLRTEELDWLADPVLATPVSRLRWAASHLSVAAVGPGIVLAAFGLAAGLTYGLSSGDIGRELPRVLAASLAYLPAIWVLAGIAALLYGLLPRFVIASWAPLIVFLLIEAAWEFQQVSLPVYNLTPFAHAPKILIGQGITAPFFLLIVIAAALAIAGLAGFRRGDVRRV